MKNSLRILISLCFIALISFASFGQGTVRGVITAGDDNSPLISATVVLKGTTKGVITDFNGVYAFSVEEGEQTVVVSYIGFETKEEVITVEKGKITTLNVSLDPMSVMGEEVVVTVQARGQIAAVNQQVNSDQIVNVVSAERIRELPDENAAQAISRLPGVHLDGNKVVIRGVESRMNKIMINGIEMPSTEEDTRAADLGMVSANMLSGIEVFKTLTPDMDADAIGGVVNMRLRSAPKELHYSITAQSGYNSQEKLVRGVKLWGDVSNRFLDDKLGVLLNLNYETRKGGDEWLDVSYSLYESGAIGDGTYILGGVNVYDQELITKNMGGSLVLDYKLKNGKLTYTNMMSQTNPEETEYSDRMDPRSQYRYGYLNHKRHNQLLINNSLLWEQQVGLLKLDASISNVSVNKEYDIFYEARVKDPGSPKPFYIDSIKDNVLLNMDPVDVYGLADPKSEETALIQDVQITPRQYWEKQWIADFNALIPLQLTDNIGVNFKLGGKYLRKDRNFDRQFLIYAGNFTNTFNLTNDDIHDWLLSQGIDNDGSALFFRDIRNNDYVPNNGGDFMGKNSGYKMEWIIDKDFMDEMWLEQVDLDPATTHLANDANDVMWDYWGFETLKAGYAMATINLGKDITIIPGVRIESVHNEYTAYKTSSGSTGEYVVHDTLTMPADNVNILPHLHLRYSVTDWWDIRFSYNNTMSRPNYNYAVPTVYFSTQSGATRVGNPYIKPAISQNLDANFTFYSRKLGLITIGAYMKTMKDIFYDQRGVFQHNVSDTMQAQFPLDKFPSLKAGTTNFYTNSEFPAFIKGMELEWQSNLSWLPAPFNGIVLNANYTHVWSETKYYFLDASQKVKVPGSLIPKTLFIDSFYVNRLLQQANDIANISLGYDYKGFSARLSFRYQGNVISTIGTRVEENEYTNDIYAYDFVVKQKIPVKFADFEVFFNAINFTNVPKARYSDYPHEPGPGHVMTYSRYSGAQFQLGLRLRH